MSSKNTDPQWRPPPSTPGEGTEPGADKSRLAAELLENLAKAPLPEEGVAETKGHDAASFAVGPHTPPRARDDAFEDEPAVVLNTTQPFGNPVTPDPIPLGTPPPAPTTVSEDAITAPRAKKVLPETVPSARVRKRHRAFLVAASILGLMGVLLIVAFSRPSDPPPAPAAASTPATTTASTTATTATTATTEPPPLVEGTAATTTVTAATAEPAAPATTTTAAPRKDPPRKPSSTAQASAAPATTTTAAPRPTSSSDFPWRQ